jgi:hypothetical protein
VSKLTKKEKEARDKERRQWGKIGGRPGGRYENWACSIIQRHSTPDAVNLAAADFDTGEIIVSKTIDWKIGERRLFQEGVRNLSDLYRLYMVRRDDCFFIVWGITAAFKDRGVTAWKESEAGNWEAVSEVTDDLNFRLSTEKLNYYQYFDRYGHLSPAPEDWNEKRFYDEMEKANEFLFLQMK